MSNSALSDGQFAEHLNNPNTGGASLNFKDRTEVSGKGFMTAFSGAEKTLPLPAKEEDITSFKEKNKPAVEGNAAAVHGAWKYHCLEVESLAEGITLKKVAMFYSTLLT